MPNYKQHKAYGQKRTNNKNTTVPTNNGTGIRAGILRKPTTGL